MKCRLMKSDGIQPAECYLKVFNYTSTTTVEPLSNYAITQSASEEPELKFTP